jgi:hypothetical protein
MATITRHFDSRRRWWKVWSLTAIAFFPLALPVPAIAQTAVNHSAANGVRGQSLATIVSACGAIAAGLPALDRCRQAPQAARSAPRVDPVACGPSICRVISYDYL